MLTDVFTFKADGTYSILGDDTWLESWQGVDEGCGAPVALMLWGPHGLVMGSSTSW